MEALSALGWHGPRVPPIKKHCCRRKARGRNHRFRIYCCLKMTQNLGFRLMMSRRFQTTSLRCNTAFVGSRAASPSLSGSSARFTPSCCVGDEEPTELGASFRRSQNWVGGSRPGHAAFAPPPPERLMECLDSFERFLHDQKHKLPVLVEAGLIHVQFETIHPFLDGNGRLGRLSITFLLCSKGALRTPACTSACTSKRTVTDTTTYFSVYEHTVPGKSGRRFFWRGQRSQLALPLRPPNRF
jgi:hypothetical protein